MSIKYVMMFVLLTILSGCGEQFNQATSDLSACLVGEWTEQPGRRADLTEGTLWYYDDGRYRLERIFYDGTVSFSWQIETGSWRILDGLLVAAELKSVKEWGDTLEDAQRNAEAVLASTPENIPIERATSTHCDQEFLKHNILAKVSDEPLTYEGVIYSVFDSGIPSVKHLTRLTEFRDGLVEMVSHQEPLNGSDFETETQISHAGYQINTFLTATEVEIIECIGESGCDLPADLPLSISHIYYDTALSRGTTFHAVANYEGMQYWYR